MDILFVLSFILASCFAVSYGWGMRGTTIGGEKGAMLPGALMGTLFAMFSGAFIAIENYYVFGALGAIGMYFGGAMTYGETLSLSMSARPAVSMRKGITALFVKGFLWLAVFGSVFSTGICAVSGLYKWFELLILFIITPILAIAGLKLFNRPVNPDEVKYPKIYFSKTRKEYWGAMLGLVVAFLIVNIIKLNIYPLIFTLVCGLSGGIGFSIGQLVQIYFKYYAESSKLHPLRKIGQSKIIDTWKAMECTFGAIIGIGCSIAALITRNQFKSIIFNVEKNGGILPVSKSLVNVLFVIWLLLLVIDMGHYFVKKPLNISQIKELKLNNKLSDDKYFRLMFNAQPDSTKQFKKTQRYFEALEFIIYAAIPFALIGLGSSLAAQITAVFVMFWILVQEIAFERNNKSKEQIICLSVIGLVILAIQLFGHEFSLTGTMIIYTIVYEVATLYHFIPQIIAQNVKSESLNVTLTRKDKILALMQSKGFVISNVYFIVAIILTFVFI